MEPNWHAQGFYSYYPHDPNRSSERQTVSPVHEPANLGEPSHRRSFTQPPHPTFLPPPHTASASSHNMNLPPFSQTFYSSYHSTPSAHQPSASAPSSMHLAHNMAYGSHVPMSAPGSQAYHHPVASPVAMSAPPFPGSAHRQPPPHSYNESPRVPSGYSSSPGMRHISPTSPTTHLAPPGMSASTGSTSSSSYPSATRTSSGLTKVKRRSGSASQSNESWDDGEGRYNLSLDTKEEGDLEDREEGDEQPWGMPQDEYKALNPRDKKQVRNRIGARRFRAKRKDYVSTLEGSLRVRDDEVHSLRSQLESYRNEINDLRTRLSMPLLPPPPPDTGLMGARGSAEGWDGGGEDRKDI